MDSNLMWYHGQISHEKCENLLQNEYCSNNWKRCVFLVRDCSTPKYKFVLSLFENGKTRHIPIVQHGKDAIFSFINGKEFHGIDELIRNCLYSDDKELKISLKSSVFVKGNFPPLKYCKFGVTTSLHVAVMNHDLSQIMHLQSRQYKHINFCIDDKNEDGKTALHIACSDKSISQEIPKFLIIKNASLFLRDAAGKIPLFYAIENNLIEVAKLMISKSRDVVQVKDSATLDVPLHIAARLGRLEIVKILLQNNASQFPINKDGKFPIELADEKSHANVVKFLEFRRTKSVKHAWSHGTIDRGTAKFLLTQKRNSMKKRNADDDEIAGLFLLRFSEKINKNVITMLTGDDVKNYEISKTAENYHLTGGPWHPSIDDLIAYHKEFADGLAAKLTIPLKPTGSEDDEDYSEVQFPLSEVSYEEIGFKEGGDYDWLKKSTPVAEDPYVDDLYVNERRLDISDEILGEGNYGTVHKGLLTIPGHVVHVAVKTLITREDEDFDAMFCSFLREAGTMMNFNNPFIVRMIGIVKGPPMKIVQELQSLGSLDKYLKNSNNDVTCENIHTWAAQIADGMSYLESKRFVHRDLAARNILLASKTHARISDFGLSRPISIENGTCNVSEDERLPIRWYAPESFDKIYTHASDVWSFGVTIWEAYTRGALPYANIPNKEFGKFLLKGGRLEKPKNCNIIIYEKLLECWSIDSKKRPTFDELRRFFKCFAPIYSNVNMLVRSKLESELDL